MPEFYQRVTPKKEQRDRGPDAARLVSILPWRKRMRMEDNKWGSGRRTD